MNITQSVYERIVHEVAERYINQGYSVKIEPLESDLPDFLKGFHPDLLVRTPEDNIVIEIKIKGKTRDLDYWQKLQHAIEQHPGWRFHLILNDKREEELMGIEMPVLTEEEVKERLEASKTLANSGLLDSALVIAWSTLEAVLRAESRAEGLALPNQGAGPLITALYTEGSLEDDDYNALQKILAVRNQAVHGFRVENIDRSLIEQTQDIANRLLSQDRKAA